VVKTKVFILPVKTGVLSDIKTLCITTLDTPPYAFEVFDLK